MSPVAGGASSSFFRCNNLQETEANSEKSCIFEVINN